ncbi:hypothetical protein C8Q76DRAFT_160178 [Earliella scabrosa]|nr:hypothetical protein C8Q76DRAFT_160178 [Earliella scabrosa]
MPHSLNDIPHDILIEIARQARIQRCCRPLSETCKRTREACMPFLFSSFILDLVPAGKTSFFHRRSGVFPPRSIWIHIRTLTLLEQCIDREEWCKLYEKRQRKRTPLLAADDPTICSVVTDSQLQFALFHMPLLRTLDVCCCSIDVDRHSIPASFLRTILSIPCPLHVVVNRLVIDPTAEPSSVQFDIVSQLKSFEYRLPLVRRRPRCYQPELLALSSAVGCFHASLEKLLLPAESTPWAAMSQVQWPQLRELTLRGELAEEPPHPFIHIFSGMPRLRLLILALALPQNLDRHLIWPPDVSASYPWPELEELALSFPHPQDRLFQHLPMTLRNLSLCCWPHHYESSWYQGRSDSQWHQPLLTAKHMRQIIIQCPNPGLVSLTVEYRADDVDAMLLSRIATLFPRLTFLELHRYRQEGEDVPLDVIGRSLGRLTELHHTRLHLDFANTPGYNRTMYDFAKHKTHDLKAFKKTLTDAAVTLSQYLSSSVYLVQFASPSEGGPQWIGLSLSAPAESGMREVSNADHGTYIYYNRNDDRAVSLLDERVNGVF